jgi:hypothetical protein
MLYDTEITLSVRASVAHSARRLAVFCMTVIKMVAVAFGFLGVFTKLRKVTINFIMFACLSAWNNSTPTGRILMKFYM